MCIYIHTLKFSSCHVTQTLRAELALAKEHEDRVSRLEKDMAAFEQEVKPAHYVRIHCVYTYAFDTHVIIS
jgi:hypothetical protein